MPRNPLKRIRKVEAREPFIIIGLVRGREGFIKQIMPEVIILGCIYALPAYRDLMRAEGPKHIPIY